MKLFSKCKHKKLNPAIYAAILVSTISGGGNSQHDGLTGLGVGIVIGIMIISLLVVKKCKK